MRIFGSQFSRLECNSLGGCFKAGLRLLGQQFQGKGGDYVGGSLKAGDETDEIIWVAILQLA